MSEVASELEIFQVFVMTAELGCGFGAVASQTGVSIVVTIAVGGGMGILRRGAKKKVQAKKSPSTALVNCESQCEMLTLRPSSTFVSTRF